MLKGPRRAGERVHEAIECGGGRYGLSQELGCSDVRGSWGPEIETLRLGGIGIQTGWKMLWFGCATRVDMVAPVRRVSGFWGAVKIGGTYKGLQTLTLHSFCPPCFLRSIHRKPDIPVPYLYFDMGAAVLCASFMSFGVKRRWFALGAALQLAISTYAAYIGGYVHYGDWLKVST